MTVVDASFVVKWFAEEPGAETARSIAQKEKKLVAPAHLVVETGRGLLRHMRNRHITHEFAEQALVRLPLMIKLLPLEALVTLALRIAHESSITIYDALYVSAAVREDCALITADQRLIRGLGGTHWSERAISLTGWTGSSPRSAPVSPSSQE